MKIEKNRLLASAINFGESPYFFYLLIGVTASLVFFEFKYNIALLDSISNPKTNPSDAEALSNKGKLLASFGLTWALFKGIIQKVRNFFASILIIGMITFSFYWILDTVYDRVIDNLRPEIKVMGFNLLSYRQDLLKGELEDPDIPNLRDEPVVGKIFMGAFPIVLLDQRFMVPAQDIVSRKADEKQAETLEISDQKWIDYQKNMSALKEAYSQYIKASRKARGEELEEDWQTYSRKMENISKGHQRYISAAKRAMKMEDLSKDWAAYNSQMNKIRNSHNEFIQGSIKAASYGSRGTNEFRRRSGGLDPNSRLPLSQFPTLIKRSSHPQAAEIRQAEKRVIARNIDGSPVYAGEMPYFMSRDAFQDWIAKKSGEGLNNAGFPINPALSREKFVDLIKESNTENGAELRKFEEREIGQKRNGGKVYGKDVPYFMSHSDFSSWSSSIARESLEAAGFSPNSEASLQDFINILRNSSSEEGKRLRDAEKGVVAQRPDGSSLLVRDVPYFMDKMAYKDWVNSEAEKFRSMAMPTKENVDALRNIKQINSAMFIPPMAIISSLTSALVNAISLVLFALASLLAVLPRCQPVGQALKKFNVIAMVSVFSVLVYSMPDHVFREETALYGLETKLHAEVGPAAMLWSRLSNIQKLFL